MNSMNTLSIVDRMLKVVYLLLFVGNTYVRKKFARTVLSTKGKMKKFRD